MTFAGSVLHHYETELKRLRSEYSGLSGSKRLELENLLMQGDLHEVAMEEVQQLWLILQQDAELQSAYERSGLQEDELGQFDEEDRRKRRKRKDPSPAASLGSNASSESTSKGPPSKRRKRVTRSTTPKSSPSPAPSNSSSHSKQQ